MKIASLFLAAVLCTTSWTQAQNRDEPPTFTKAELTQKDNGRLVASLRLSPIRAMLLKKVDQVSWVESPLSDVVDWLRTQSAETGTVNVVLRIKALAIESVDEETPVSLEMSDTTVAQVLNEVLDQLSDTDPLTYIGINNTLRISTKSDFDKKLYTRIYNIDDVFFEIHNFRGSPQIDLNQRQQNQGGGGGQGGQPQVQSIFGQSGGGGEDDDDDDDGQDEERATEIMEWIRTTVEPESWEENGGLGKLAVFNKMLTIHNTLEVHEQLGGPFRFDE